MHYSLKMVFMSIIPIRLYVDRCGYPSNLPRVVNVQKQLIIKMYPSTNSVTLKTQKVHES